METDPIHPPAASLPPRFVQWFERRGWRPHRHQLAMLAAARAGRPALLVAPTGGGKTLAGFLPSLIELAAAPTPGLHTIYLSPLKALAADIRRNIEGPVRELEIPIRVEARTGDTRAAERQRQRAEPPQILLTTPESLTLLLSYPEAATMFSSLRAIILDELHAIAGTKRGDQMALGLSRLMGLAPAARRVGLSATVAFPDELARFLDPDPGAVARIMGDATPEPEISIMRPEQPLPWAGHMGLHAMPEVLLAIKAHTTTLVFVNTRAQAELVFQELWRLNDDNMPIALHHGSLSPEQREKVEGAMVAGQLKAIVATSSLDLGVDWASVDLVIQIGAPKGASRLMQRIGRANHRFDLPSRAILAPANRFEVLECEAALGAVRDRHLDGEPPRPGGLDVLAQHILGAACAGALDADALYAEVLTAAPYRDLSRRDFDDVLGFVETGGYALKTYDRWRRLFRDSQGRYHATGADVVRRFRMNIGTIIESPMLKVRVRGGGVVGELEEWFAQGLVQGDTFIFAGQLLVFERIREMSLECFRGSNGQQPKVPAFQGGRLPLSTYLADRVRALLADPDAWGSLPDAVREWLGLQRWRSVLPGRDGLLVEVFPRGGRWFLVAYCFEGRPAHQTLGMLLTRRMERAGYRPLGFVATDYVLATWSVDEPTAIDDLFDEDMMGDDLEAWMAESSMLRRTFRNVAIIAGLIDRTLPGIKKTGRQVTFNSDLIYDVLRRHEPDHVLLRATRADAAGGLTDVKRLSDMLARVKGRIDHRRLERISPLAVPVLLEIGKEQVFGNEDGLLADAEALVAEAMAPLDQSLIEPAQVGRS